MTHSAGRGAPCRGGLLHGRLAGELDRHLLGGLGVERDPVHADGTAADAERTVSRARSVGRCAHGARAVVGLARLVEPRGDGAGAGRQDLQGERRPGIRVRVDHDLGRAERARSGLRLAGERRCAGVALDRVARVGLVEHIECDLLAARERDCVRTRAAGRRHAVREELGVAVAVVVPGRRALLLRARVDVRVLIVAVAGLATDRAGAEQHGAVAPAVAIVVAALVGVTVAVVVLPVAGFDLVHPDLVAHGAQAVAAADDRTEGAPVIVLAVASITEAVEALVDLLVAVVVLQVAQLRRGRIDRIVGVVAIGILLHHRVGRLAGEHTALRISVAVAILVGVERRLDVFVDLAVAVVVLLVADLDDALAELLGAHDAHLIRTARQRAHLAQVRVVAVAGVAESVEALVDLLVAVVVDVVADLQEVRDGLVGALVGEAACGARVGAHLAVVTVRAIAGLTEHEALVGLAVAVVVDVVARLGGSRVGVRQRGTCALAVLADDEAGVLTRRVNGRGAGLPAEEAQARHGGLVGERRLRVDAARVQVLRVRIHPGAVVVGGAGRVLARDRPAFEPWVRAVVVALVVARPAVRVAAHLLPGTLHVAVLAGRVLARLGIAVRVELERRLDGRLLLVGADVGIVAAAADDERQRDSGEEHSHGLLPHVLYTLFLVMEPCRLTGCTRGVEQLNPNKISHLVIQNFVGVHTSVVILSERSERRISKFFGILHFVALSATSFRMTEGLGQDDT